jgi:hypothetical protein
MLNAPIPGLLHQHAHMRCHLAGFCRNVRQLLQKLGNICSMKDIHNSTVLPPSLLTSVSTSDTNPMFLPPPPEEEPYADDQITSIESASSWNGPERSVGSCPTWSSTRPRCLWTMVCTPRKSTSIGSLSSQLQWTDPRWGRSGASSKYTTRPAMAFAAV